MNRTLKRPMFRMGGSTGSGITSGLDTTKPKRGLVDEPGGRAGYKMGTLPYDMAEILRGTAEQVKDPEILSAYKPYFERPAGEATSRFLTSFGLDLLGRSPTGNIFQTAAQSAKAPTEQLYKDIDEQRLMKRASEADLFKTLLQGNIDVAAAAAGEGEGGKTYAKLEIANDIETTMKEILDLEKQLKAGQDVKAELDQKKARIDYLTKENPVGKSLMNQTEFAESVLKSIITSLQTEKGLTGELKYPDGKKDPELLKEAYKQYQNFFEQDFDEGLAKGGRAGYKMGTPPGGITDVATVNINTPGMQAQEAMPMDQEPKIDFETLRVRLPREISDDIVKLIAASPQAMEDFATIATQQDVDQFNKKYSVNLVLPQEA
jgi:hypothetical protein